MPMTESRRSWDEVAEAPAGSQAEADEPVRFHLQEDGSQNHRAGGRRVGVRVGQPLWNGNIGTLIAKPRKKARNTHHCRSTRTCTGDSA